MFLKCIVFMCYVFSIGVKCGVLPNDVFHLDIVHYNDFHARFEETSLTDTVCKSNDTNCIGGFARLYYEINEIRKKKPDALLLDAGDDFQGTFWYTLMKYNVTEKFINMLPNDAHALGNHEFDDGVQGLVPYLKALRDPVVAANIDTSDEPSMNGLYHPHVILERNGRKIGIIGLVTTDTKTSSNPQGVKFLDPIPVVQREAVLLTQLGVDIIVVLSHCGLYVDKDIAQSVGENIDIIVGGHTHSLLWNGTAPNNEPVTDTYPVLVETESKPGHKVLVVTASAYSKYLGNIGVDFDKNGELLTFEAKLVFLNRDIPEDPEILELLKPYKDQLHELVNEVVGTTTDDLLLDSCSIQECVLGNMVADSFLELIKEKSTSNLTSIALLPKGIIRWSIYKGDITRGDIISVQPFTNSIVSANIQGRYIKEAIELFLKSYSTVMPQFAGLKVTVNMTSLEVVSLFVKDGDELRPLQQDEEYQVALNDYTARVFDVLKNNKRNVINLGTDRMAVEAYVKKMSPITLRVDNRLTIVT